MCDLCRYDEKTTCIRLKPTWDETMALAQMADFPTKPSIPPESPFIHQSLIASPRDENDRLAELPSTYTGPSSS
jgi:type III secretory pathway lipoprotein EscJ